MKILKCQECGLQYALPDAEETLPCNHESLETKVRDNVGEYWVKHAKKYSALFNQNLNEVFHRLLEMQSRAKEMRKQV